MAKEPFLGPSANTVSHRAGGGRPGERYSSFYKAKFEPIEETEAGRLEALRDGRCPPSGRPDFRIARRDHAGGGRLGSANGGAGAGRGGGTGGGSHPHPDAVGI